MESVPITTNIVCWNLTQSGEVYSIQYNVIKFVSDRQLAGGFFWVCHNITEILLKVALNTITLIPILFSSNIKCVF